MICHMIVAEVVLQVDDLPHKREVYGVKFTHVVILGAQSTYRFCTVSDALRAVCMRRFYCNSRFLESVLRPGVV